MVSLIPLTKSDGEILEQVHATCFPDAWNRETFNQLLDQTNSCGWLALSLESKPIGFIIARVVEDEAEILTFAVTPSFQGKRVGHSLLSELLNFLRSVRCNKIYLEVALDNKVAIHLYKTLGFEEVGKRPDYYKRDKDTVIDGMVMLFHCPKISNS